MGDRISFEKWNRERPAEFTIPIYTDMDHGSYVLENVAFHLELDVAAIRDMVKMASKGGKYINGPISITVKPSRERK